MQNGPIRRTVWQFLIELNVHLPFDPAIPELSVYPKEMTVPVHIKTCTWTFIAALFLIAEHWKQPECPSTGKSMNRLYYVNITDRYSTIKMDELLIICNNMDVFQKTLYYMKKTGTKEYICMIPFIWGSKKHKIDIQWWKTDSRLLRLDGGWEHWLPAGMRASRCGGRLTVVATWAHAFVETYQNVYSKYFYYRYIMPQLHFLFLKIRYTYIYTYCKCPQRYTQNYKQEYFIDDIQNM